MEEINKNFEQFTANNSFIPVTRSGRGTLSRDNSANKCTDVEYEIQSLTNNIKQIDDQKTLIYNSMKELNNRVQNLNNTMKALDSEKSSINKRIQELNNKLNNCRQTGGKKKKQTLKIYTGSRGGKYYKKNGKKIYLR